MSADLIDLHVGDLELAAQRRFETPHTCWRYTRTGKLQATLDELRTKGLDDPETEPLLGPVAADLADEIDRRAAFHHTTTTGGHA